MIDFPIPEMRSAAWALEHRRAAGEDAESIVTDACALAVRCRELQSGIRAALADGAIAPDRAEYMLDRLGLVVDDCGYIVDQLFGTCTGNACKPLRAAIFQGSELELTSPWALSPFYRHGKQIGE
jgi:hypothetical protein